MANNDFDAIYEEEIVDDIIEDHHVIVPDPIVIRGAGNMTVYVWLLSIVGV